MSLIKKLSSITADDLKNIDWASMKNYLLSQPGLLINILIISMTVSIIVATFRSHVKLTKTLKTKVTELKEKAEALDKFELAQVEYKKFLKNIPQTISENRLIEMLSGIAFNRDVRIVSFSPANRSSNRFVNLTNVEITVTSKNYTDIIRFINDIENSTYAIRLGGWTGVSKSQNQSSRRRLRSSESIQAEDEYIETKVKIETVEFKYD